MTITSKRRFCLPKIPHSDVEAVSGRFYNKKKTEKDINQGIFFKYIDGNIIGYSLVGNHVAWFGCPVITFY